MNTPVAVGLILLAIAFVLLVAIAVGSVRLRDLRRGWESQHELFCWDDPRTGKRTCKPVGHVSPETRARLEADYNGAVQ